MWILFLLTPKLIPYGFIFPFFSKKKKKRMWYKIFIQHYTAKILTFYTWDDPATSSSGNAVEERDTFISSFFFGYFCFFTFQKNSISCGSSVLYKYFTLFLLFFLQKSCNYKKQPRRRGKEILDLVRRDRIYLTYT